MKKKKRRPKGLRFYFAIRSLPQPARGMGEQGVDQPCLRGEVAAQRLRVAVLAGDVVEQPLELVDVAVDRLLEGAVGAVFAGDLVERLLAGRRVEALGEGLVLAAEMWDRYQRGESKAFTKRLYTPAGQKAFDEVARKYRTDRAFKQTVDRYIAEFERLLDEVAREDRGPQALRGHLTSETGLVYTLLAHAAGRLG